MQDRLNFEKNTKNAKTTLEGEPKNAVVYKKNVLENLSAFWAIRDQ